MNVRRTGNHSLYFRALFPPSPSPRVPPWRCVIGAAASGRSLINATVRLPYVDLHVLARKTPFADFS